MLSKCQVPTGTNCKIDTFFTLYSPHQNLLSIPDAKLEVLAGSSSSAWQYILYNHIFCINHLVIQYEVSSIILYSVFQSFSIFCVGPYLQYKKDSCRLNEPIWKRITLPVIVNQSHCKTQGIPAPWKGKEPPIKSINTPLNSPK